MKITDVKNGDLTRYAVLEDAQARKLDLDGIAELAKSIKNEGLQKPTYGTNGIKESYSVLMHLPYSRHCASMNSKVTGDL